MWPIIKICGLIPRAIRKSFHSSHDSWNTAWVTVFCFLSPRAADGFVSFLLLSLWLRWDREFVTSLLLILIVRLTAIRHVFVLSSLCFCLVWSFVGWSHPCLPCMSSWPFCVARSVFLSWGWTWERLLETSRGSTVLLLASRTRCAILTSWLVPPSLMLKSRCSPSCAAESSPRWRVFAARIIKLMTSMVNFLTLTNISVPCTNVPTWSRDVFDPPLVIVCTFGFRVRSWPRHLNPLRRPHGHCPCSKYVLSLVIHGGVVDTWNYGWLINRCQVNCWLDLKVDCATATAFPRKKSW